MLAVISPAKKLKFDEPPVDLPVSEPEFLSDTHELASVCRKLTRADLRAMMKISDALADLNHQRFQTFSTSPSETQTRPAVLAFAGDTYTGLDAPSLDKADLNYAQDHLRILSGLYGLLRPLDLIQPYRLEMGRKLKTKRGETLYAFWGDRLAKALDARLANHKHPVLINLASHEYFRAVEAKALKARVITPVFKEFKNDQYKVIGLFAKRARGAMARYMIKHRLEDPQDLQRFAEDGYRFRPDMTTGDNWVFARRQ